MTILVDQNLPTRLARWLVVRGYAATHVKDYGWEREADENIWESARQRSATIVTKDKDFAEMSLVDGPPPKVVLIRKPNCSTDDLIAFVDHHEETLRSFGSDPLTGLLVLT